MDKQKLLKKVHKLIWKNGDLMEQDDLSDLQDLIDNEIVTEAKKGTMEIKQLENGFIKEIKIK